MIAQHQAELAAAEEALAAEKVAHGSAVTSLKAGLDLAQQEASSLQNQLKALESQLAAGKQAFGTASHTAASFPLRAAQQQAAAETQAHEEVDWRVPSYQTPVQSAQQVVFALRTKLEAMQQELTEKTADETVNWAVSSLLDDMQAAQQQLSVGVSMQQAHQAGSPTAADLQLDWADSKTQCLQEVSACTSCHLHAPIYVYLDTSYFHIHMLICIKGVKASGRNQEMFRHLPELSFALSLTFLYACLPACWLAHLLTDSIAEPRHHLTLQGANGSLVEEEQGEQAGAGAVAGLGHQVAGLGHQVEEAAQRRPSPLQTPLPSPLQTPLPSPLQSPLPSPFQVPLPSPLQVPLPAFLVSSLSLVRNTQSCGSAEWMTSAPTVSTASVLLDVMIECQCAASLAYITASASPDMEACQLQSMASSMSHMEWCRQGLQFKSALHTLQFIITAEEAKLTWVL